MYIKKENESKKLTNNIEIELKSCCEYKMSFVHAW